MACFQVFVGVTDRAGEDIIGHVESMNEALDVAVLGVSDVTLHVWLTRWLR